MNLHMITKDRGVCFLYLKFGISILALKLKGVFFFRLRDMLANKFEGRDQ